MSSKSLGNRSMTASMSAPTGRKPKKYFKVSFGEDIEVDIAPQASQASEPGFRVGHIKGQSPRHRSSSNNSDGSGGDEDMVDKKSSDVLGDEHFNKKRQRTNTMAVMNLMRDIHKMEDEVEGNRKLLEQAMMVGKALEESYRQIDELHAQNKALDDTNTLLRKTVKDLEEDLAQSSRIGHTPTQRNIRDEGIAKDNYDELMEEMKAQEQELDMMRDRIQELEMEKEELLASPFYSENSYNDRRQSSSKRRMTYMDVAAQIQELTEANEAVEMKLLDTREERDEMVQAYQEAKQELLDLKRRQKEEHVGFQEKIGELQKVIREQQDALLLAKQAVLAAGQQAVAMNTTVGEGALSDEVFNATAAAAKGRKSMRRATAVSNFRSQFGQLGKEQLSESSSDDGDFVGRTKRETKERLPGQLDLLEGDDADGLNLEAELMELDESGPNPSWVEHEEYLQMKEEMAEMKARHETALAEERQRHEVTTQDLRKVREEMGTKDQQIVGLLKQLHAQTIRVVQAKSRSPAERLMEDTISAMKDKEIGLQKTIAEMRVGMMAQKSVIALREKKVTKLENKVQKFDTGLNYYRVLVSQLLKKSKDQKKRHKKEVESLKKKLREKEPNLEFEGFDASLDYLNIVLMDVVRRARWMDMTAYEFRLAAAEWQAAERSMEVKEEYLHNMEEQESRMRESLQEQLMEMEQSHIKEKYVAAKWDLKSTENKVQKLSTQVAELQAELDIAKQPTVQMLASGIKEEEEGGTAEEVAALSAKVAGLQAELEIAKQSTVQEKEGKEEEVAALTAKVAELQAELDIAKQPALQEKEGKEEEVAALAAKVAELHAELEIATQSTVQVAELQAELKIAKQSMVQEKEGKEEEVAALTAKVAELQAELIINSQSMAQEKEGKEEEFAALTAKVAELQSELKIAKQSTEQIKEEKEGKEEKVAALTAKVAEMQAELKIAKQPTVQDKEGKDEEVAALMAKVAELQADLKIAKQSPVQMLGSAAPRIKEEEEVEAISAKVPFNEADHDNFDKEPWRRRFAPCETLVQELRRELSKHKDLSCKLQGQADRARDLVSTVMTKQPLKDSPELTIELSDHKSTFEEEKRTAIQEALAATGSTEAEPETEVCSTAGPDHSFDQELVDQLRAELVLKEEQLTESASLVQRARHYMEESQRLEKLLQEREAGQEALLKKMEDQLQELQKHKKDSKEKLLLAEELTAKEEEVAACRERLQARSAEALEVKRSMMEELSKLRHEAAHKHAEARGFEEQCATVTRQVKDLEAEVRHLRGQLPHGSGDIFSRNRSPSIGSVVSKRSVTSGLFSNAPNSGASIAAAAAAAAASTAASSTGSPPHHLAPPTAPSVSLSASGSTSTLHLHPPTPGQLSLSALEAEVALAVGGGGSSSPSAASSRRPSLRGEKVRGSGCRLNPDVRMQLSNRGRNTITSSTTATTAATSSGPCEETASVCSHPPPPPPSAPLSAVLVMPNDMPKVALRTTEPLSPSSPDGPTSANFEGPSPAEPQRQQQQQQQQNLLGYLPGQSAPEEAAQQAQHEAMQEAQPGDGEGEAGEGGGGGGRKGNEERRPSLAKSSTQQRHPTPTPSSTRPRRPSLSEKGYQDSVVAGIAARFDEVANKHQASQRNQRPSFLADVSKLHDDFARVHQRMHSTLECGSGCASPAAPGTSRVPVSTAHAQSSAAAKTVMAASMSLPASNFRGKGFAPMSLKCLLHGVLACRSPICCKEQQPAKGEATAGPAATTSPSPGLRRASTSAAAASSAVSSAPPGAGTPRMSRRPSAAQS